MAPRTGEVEAQEAVAVEVAAVAQGGAGGETGGGGIVDPAAAHVEPGEIRRLDMGRRDLGQRFGDEALDQVAVAAQVLEQRAPAMVRPHGRRSRRRPPRTTPGISYSTRPTPGALKRARSPASGTTAKANWRPGRLKVLLGDISVTVRCGDGRIGDGRRDVAHVVEQQVAVDLVGAQHQVVATAEGGQGRDLVALPRAAERVVRVAEDEQPRVGSDRLLQLVEGEAPAPVAQGRRHRQQAAALRDRRLEDRRIHGRDGHHRLDRHPRTPGSRGAGRR